MRASAAFPAGQRLCRAGQTLLKRTAACNSQPVLAAGGERAGGGGSAARARPRRDEVHLLIPGQPPLRLVHVTQRSLNSVLGTLGALGFETATGGCSQELEDLPEGGEVKLVLRPDLPTATQVRNLQRAFDNSTRGQERELEAFLRALASAENAGAPITALPTTPFKGADGQDYVQLDAAFRIGHLLYVGELKRVLGEGSVVDLAAKLTKLRLALTSGASPDLAAALQGVTQARLFLGGEVVRAGLPEQQMAERAAAAGMSLVLPSGAGLGLVGGAAPAVQLL